MHSRPIGFTLACALLLSASPTRLASQGAVHISVDHARFEIPLGRHVRDQWRWNEPATETNYAEYMWSVRLDGDTTHSIGFALFKFPGATPGSGSFADLLRAGQLSVSTVVRHRAQMLRNVRPSATFADSTLTLELRDPALIAAMIARRPREATVFISSPYADTRTEKVVIQYAAP